MSVSDRKKGPVRELGDAESLLHDLRRAGEEMSPADFREQTMSYVMGCVAGDDSAAREKVRQHLEKSYSSVPGP